MNLTKDNFYSITISNREYHVPINFKEFWYEDVQKEAINNNFIIPTLEEIFQYIDEDKNGKNIETIRKHLQGSWLFTNTQLEEDNHYYTASVYDAKFREEHGLKPVEKTHLGSLNYLTSLNEQRSHGWQDITIVGKYEPWTREGDIRKLIKALTGKEYEEAMDTMNKIFPELKKKIYITTLGNKPASLIIKDDFFGIMCKYGFCGGRHCTPN